MRQRYPSSNTSPTHTPVFQNTFNPSSDSLITNDDRTRSQLSFFSCYVCGTHLRSSWMRKACRQALSDLYFSRLTDYLCSQECLKLAWKDHKKYHETELEKMCSFPDGIEE